METAKRPQGTSSFLETRQEFSARHHFGDVEQAEVVIDPTGRSPQRSDVLIDAFTAGTTAGVYFKSR